MRGQEGWRRRPVRSAGCGQRRWGDATTRGLLQSWGETGAFDLEQGREGCPSAVSLPESLAGVVCGFQRNACWCWGLGEWDEWQGGKLEEVM